MPKLFGGLSFDFGLPSGLAARVDTRQDIANLRQNEMLERQKRIDAETKAKLFADDLQFGKAANPWDHKILKDFTQNKVRELGKYVNENPDWNTDPFKFAQVKKLKNDLIDNDVVYRSQRIKAEYDAMNKWYDDPKNKELINMPEVGEMRNRYRNYINTGSADGVQGNNVEFAWQQPSMGVDLSAVFAQRARTVQRLGSRDYKSGLRFVNEQYVTKNDMMREAIDLTNDKGLQGISIRKQYQELLDAGQIPEKQGIQDWVFDNLWNNRNESSIKDISSSVYASRNGQKGSGNIRPYDTYFADPTTHPTNETLKDFVSWDKNGVDVTDQGFYMKSGDEYINIQSSRLSVIPGRPKAFKQIMGPNQIGVLTEFEIPLEDENYMSIVEELGQNGLINSTEWFQSMGNNFDEPENIEINSDMIRWKTWKDKDDNEKYSLIVNGFVPHLRNSINKVQHDQRFGTKAATPFDPAFPARQAIVSDDGKWAWNGTEWVPTNR